MFAQPSFCWLILRVQLLLQSQGGNKKSFRNVRRIRKHFFCTGIERIIFQSTQFFERANCRFSVQAARHSTSAVISSSPFFSHSSGIMGLRRILLAILKIALYFLCLYLYKPTGITEITWNIHLLHLLTLPTACKLPYYYFLINIHPSLRILFYQFWISCEIHAFNSSFSLLEDWTSKVADRAKSLILFVIL